jgi:hypothetical protein
VQPGNPPHATYKHTWTLLDDGRGHRALSCSLLCAVAAPLCQLLRAEAIGCCSSLLCWRLQLLLSVCGAVRSWERT